MKPYVVLGVDSNASDKEIRKAYLDAIKVASPESNPKRFQALNQAYESIKDETARHRYSIFCQKASEHSLLDAACRFASNHMVNHPLPYAKMLEHLKKCAKT